jgi:spore maturation protein CgeB
MKSPRALDIAIFGLSITSAWGNGHATTYRALAQGLAARGHRVRFFERDVAWYASNRDLARQRYCDVHLYTDIKDLNERFAREIDADLVILGSYVPQGSLLAEWLLPRARGVTAFYDIDTPVTLARLERGECDYLTREQIPRFDLYLSFAGGPVLGTLKNEYGAARPRPFYCSVDPSEYRPAPGTQERYDLGYLGTYSPDRQPTLERLLLEPARRWSSGRFCVAGAQYPAEISWPGNIETVDHLPPAAHRRFYNSQRLTLNVTRADMIAKGYSPSVRLFEAAACAVPILTDYWTGLEEFFIPGKEILVARTTAEALEYVRDRDRGYLRQIAARARSRVLSHHTSAHRACELEHYVNEVIGREPRETESRDRASVAAARVELSA